MNNIKEKLIELIASAKVQTLSFLPPRPISEDYTPYFIETIADHLIANGVTVQRWIPVSERLPECGNLVLAIDCDGLMSTAYYVGRWHGMLDEDAITHWMPLPQPPKGK